VHCDFLPKRIYVILKRHEGIAMRYSLIIALFLCACAPSLETIQRSRNDAITGVMNCAAQNWPSHAAQADCEDHAMLAAYQGQKYPYMDLIQWMADQNMLVAKMQDSGQMTDAQASEIISTDFRQMEAQADERLERDRKRTELIAQGLANMSKSTATTQPPPPAHQSTNCMTTFIGNQAQTYCY